MERQVRSKAMGLADEALRPASLAFGIQVAPAHAWDEGERRIVPLDNGTTLFLDHDEREAPLVVDNPRLLVSLTDEDDLAVCAWAIAAQPSLAGIGIDLASTSDFAGRRGERFNRLLFSSYEQSLVATHFGDRPEHGFAFAFSAKEAAFKACAAPLRDWYRTHDEELEFEVREFELADLTHERGTLRHAHAQAAMDAMGIDRIELFCRELDDAVLTLALARRYGHLGGSMRANCSVQGLRESKYQNI